MTNRTIAATLAGLMLASIAAISMSGCSSGNAAASSEATSPAPTVGISPQKFADAVHAVMMADRTVYARHVVTRLKKQESVVKPSEYWKDEEGTIPLPAQMFRMGSELVGREPRSRLLLRVEIKVAPQRTEQGQDADGD